MKLISLSTCLLAGLALSSVALANTNTKKTKHAPLNIKKPAKKTPMTNDTPAALKAKISQLKSELAQMNNNSNQPRGLKSWYRHVRISGLINADASHWTRPNFGQGTHGRSTSNYIDLATANLAASAHFGHWVSGRLSVLYSNGNSPSVKHYNPVQSPNRSIKVDQAYITIANFDKTPYFIQAGQTYLPFGHYRRYPITQTLTQVLSQTNLPAIQLGFVTSNGFYGSFYGLSGETKLHHSNHTSINNGGFSLGYSNMTHPLGFDLGVAYLMNMSDVNSVRHVIKQNKGYTRAVGASSLYMDIYAGPFGFGGRYLMANRRFSVNDYAYNTNTNTKKGARPYAAGLNADYNFKTLHHNSQLRLGYQWSSEAHNSATGVALDDATRLPKKRFVVTYGVNLFKHLATVLQLYRDYDYGKSHGGTGKQDDVATLRLSLMF
jgi:hypothetical protein